MYNQPKALPPFEITQQDPKYVDSTDKQGEFCRFREEHEDALYSEMLKNASLKYQDNETSSSSGSDSEDYDEFYFQPTASVPLEITINRNLTNCSDLSGEIIKKDKIGLEFKGNPFNGLQLRVITDADDLSCSSESESNSVDIDSDEEHKDNVYLNLDIKKEEAKTKTKSSNESSLEEAIS